MTHKVNELEKKANTVNMQYRKVKKALMLKVPVPILMTAKGLIAQQSTVDYTGLIQGGKFVAFDAKETQTKTSFPLANIHQHQLIYLEYVRELGGISFFMIHFKSVYPTKVFITPISLVQKYWDGTERKSIPIGDFKEDWLTEVDSYIEKVEEMYNGNKL